VIAFPVSQESGPFFFVVSILSNPKNCFLWFMVPRPVFNDFGTRLAPNSLGRRQHFEYAPPLYSGGSLYCRRFPEKAFSYVPMSPNMFSFYGALLSPRALRFLCGLPYVPCRG